ncbi:MAG: RICIN domain-containing protein [Deltaproteobacteria bacterium]|nr:RICIN domain-containing protein [Deltaproteobacteria bacterium]
MSSRALSVRLASSLTVVTAMAALMGGCLVEGTAEGDDDREAQGAHDGRTVTITSIHDGKVVDVLAGSRDDGAAIIQWASNGGDNQKWKLRSVRSNIYELVAVHSGKCLEIAGDRNGARAKQATCRHTSAQRFRLRWTGDSHTIVSLASSKCLDVTDFRKDDGAPLQQWSCSGNDNQSWKLRDATGTSTPPPPPPPPPDGGTSTPLVWRKANLTNYTSYPDPGSEECVKYSGCEWAGQFAALSGKQPESWVKSHNIAAVHGKDFDKYKLKTLRLRQGGRTIDATVYDMCADSDCSGCCTENSKETGFLIDIEKYTMERFGSGDGIVEWTCLDC